MKVKKESKKKKSKSGLKLNIKKTKILASSPITSWQIDGETLDPVTYFIFLGSKICAECDCSHEIKRCLLLCFLFYFLFFLVVFAIHCHDIHGFTCVPHPDPPSHLPPHPIRLGLPSAPALSTCLMHPTWAGDLFHPW